MSRESLSIFKKTKLGFLFACPALTYFSTQYLPLLLLFRYSSGYANVCCLGTPSICYYRQQASLPSSEQCTIPSCADLNSGTSSLMKGFVDLNGNTANNDAASNGTSSGANVPGQAFGSSGASAFPDATDLNAAASFKLNQLSSLVLAGSAMVYLMV